MRITAQSPEFEEYLDAREAAEAADQRLKVATMALLRVMEENQTKTVKHVGLDGFASTVTYVKPVRLSIDEQGLRKALTARVFDKYTKRVLDRKRMEEAMESGEVDPVTVAKYVHPEQGSAYIKFSQKKDQHAEEV